MKGLILALLLSGCSLLAGGSSASLGGEWQLQAGTNQGQPIPIVAGSRITLKVDGTQVGGTAACNQYGGKIHLSGTTISITNLIQTEMACLDERLMASESAFLAALPRATTATRDGDSLVLTGAHVELRFSRVAPVVDAELVGTTWILDSLISGDAVSSTVGEATLELSVNGRISASTGCRDVTGTYTMSEGRVQVTLDPYDMIACISPLGDQDSHVLNVLTSGFEVRVDGNRLTMTAGDKGLGYRAEG
jgi:heat shock protein HslJ